jgi:hypothetical protein
MERSMSDFLTVSMVASGFLFVLGMFITLISGVFKAE